MNFAGWTIVFTLCGAGGLFFVGMIAGVKLARRGINAYLNESLKKGEIDVAGVKFIPAIGKTKYHKLPTVRDRNLH